MKKVSLFLLAFLFAALVGGASSNIPSAELMVQGFNVIPLVASGVTLLGSFAPLTPAGSLCTYAMISINRNGNNPGRPVPKKDTIIIFRWEDVLNLPVRDAKGVKITTEITMKATKNAIAIYCTPSEFSAKQNSDGENDAKGWIQELILAHPGSSLELAEFLENNLNQNLGAIIVPYDVALDKRLMGDSTAPLQLDAESLDNKDVNKSTITLKSIVKGVPIAHYSGAIPTLDSGGGQSA